jgi:hypothetical protein
VSFAATSTGYVAITGGAPNGKPDEYALQLDVNGVPATAAQINTIISDINASNVGVTAETVANAGLSSAFPNYSVVLTDSLTASTQYLGFDFSNSGSDTTDPDTGLGAVTATSVAAVPEPTTAAGLIVGAGLLLGRRKNRALTAYL